MALTTIKAAGIEADAIDETKIANDGIDSEHYNDGSIDHAHLANDCIDGDNIQDNAIDSEHYTDGSIDLAHMSSESVDEDNLHISNAGSNGQFLSKQSGNAGGLTWADAGGGALSYRNKVINGDFSVSQRYGTTSNNADGYVIDRWYTQLSGATGTQQQHVFSAGSEIEGTKTYGKLDISSSGDWCSLRYRIEDVRTIIPGSWTLSFWAKGTTPPGGLKFWATQDFGSAGSADVDIGETALTALDGTWTRQSLTVTVASLSSKTINDNDSFFNFHIGQGSNTGSTAWNIEITNVQFEEGTSATDYEKKPYLHELTDCKRYFYMAADGSKGTAKHMSQWVAYTSGSIWLDFLHPVEMRAIPSMYEVSGAQGGNYWRCYHDGAVFYPDVLASANMTRTHAAVTITDDVSVTSGEAGMFWVNNSAARLGFDAEL